MSLVYPALFSLPFLALGWLCLHAGKDALSLAFASKHWPAHTGTVQSLTHVRAGIHDESRGPELKHQFYVRYFYDLGGKRHWGDWKTPAARPLAKAIARCGVEVGGPITLYYNPQKPGHSVAERGLTAERVIVSLAGLVFIAVPLPLALTVASALAQK